ncbi:hypothetical protein [Cerasicoccus fimbriatus]|uniref:hypothetical protein n=1 Tax=Cerasicoccus fimbriatus TaxID=3014554 RepID=UPI0022B3D0B1|nr:hypothetical protein [Cerasicoccus sp. TK19100]
MEIVSSFAQKLLSPDLLKEQEPVKRPAVVGGAVLVAAALAAPSAAASIQIRNDPASNKPSVVSGYALNPAENLILNGDFSEYDFDAATYYNFKDWTFVGSDNVGEDYKMLAGTRVNYLKATEYIFKWIYSSSEQPDFDSNGLLTNDVTFSFEYNLGWAQTIATEIGQSYVLQFDLFGQTPYYPTSATSTVDGISGLLIDGYAPMFIQVGVDGVATYQVQFTASSSETALTFFDIGVAQNVGSEDDVVGWSISEGAATVSPAWDNVSVTPIPEPSYFTSVIALMALGYAYRQTARRRR